MRLRTLLLTTSLALVALSLPPASADPAPDDCRPATVPFPDGSVRLRDDCTASVEVWMTCAPPSHTTVSRTLPGGHDLSLSVCDGGVGDIDHLATSSAAAPGCPPRTIERDTALGTTRVEQEHNCSTTTTLNEGIVCLGGSVERDEYHMLGHTVVVYSCGNPDQGGVGDPVAASAMPGCPPRTVQSGSGLGSVRLEQEHNCRVHVTVNEGIDCVGANSRSFSQDVSGNTVTVHYCGPPRAEVAAGAAPSCDKVPSLGAVSVSSDCHTVSIRLYECFWGGYWNERHVGPFTVRDYRCGPPPTTSAASVRDPFPTCVTEPCGPQLPTPPTAPCSAAEGTGYLPGVTYTVDAGCNVVVEAKLYDCVWNGHWRTVRAGPVVVRVYECSGPETGETSMADPFPTCVTEPCGPQVPDPCPKLQAIGFDGGLNTLSFRDDCTFELGVLDGATCVGGWGHTTERDVAGNTVRITVCDGGLGDRLGDLVQIQ